MKVNGGSSVRDELHIFTSNRDFLSMQDDLFKLAAQYSNGIKMYPSPSPPTTERCLSERRSHGADWKLRVVASLLTSGFKRRSYEHDL